MMWHSHEGAGWWMLYGAIMMVLFWGLIIWLAIWIIRGITRHEYHDRGPERRDPLDIAKERYAKGEISKEEFDRIKKDLS
jgi:putative membrane protein